MIPLSRMTLLPSAFAPALHVAQSRVGYERGTVKTAQK